MTTASQVPTPTAAAADLLRPRNVPLARTHKLGVNKNVNTGKRASMAATHQVYVQITRWYAKFFIAHETSFTGLDAKAALSAAENLTIAVSGRQAVDGWDFKDQFGSVPRDLRRAAINSAHGSVGAYLTILGTWRAGDRKHREPQLGLSNQHPVLYGQMSRVDGDFYRSGFVRLNLLDPVTGRWGWMNIGVTGRPDTGNLIAAAVSEKARQRQVRTELTQLCRDTNRLTAKGKPDFTKDERALMRQLPGSVSMTSPMLVVTTKRCSVNIAFQQIATVIKAEPGRLAGLHERVVTVDSNTHNVTVTAWNGAVMLATSKLVFSDIVDNREKAIGAIYRAARKSRHRPRGERVSHHLWERIGRQGESCARQVASWITTFAVEHQATVIVHEYLRPYRPKKGTLSAKANRKRSYWLRGKIRTYCGEKALQQSILCVDRNPAWTSHQCFRCHQLGERFSLSSTNPNNKSRFRCGNCSWTGDADFVATINLHDKWLRTFIYPAGDQLNAWKTANRRKNVAELETSPRGGAAHSANPHYWQCPVSPCSCGLEPSVPVAELSLTVEVPGAACSGTISTDLTCLPTGDATQAFPPDTNPRPGTVLQ